MPIEIKELVIKVNISDSTSETVGNNQNEEAPPQYSADNSTLVQEVVEKVLEILKEKAER